MHMEVTGFPATTVYIDRTGRRTLVHVYGHCFQGKMRGHLSKLSPLQCHLTSNTWEKIPGSTPLNAIMPGTEANGILGRRVQGLTHALTTG